MNSAFLTRAMPARRAPVRGVSASEIDNNFLI